VIPRFFNRLPLPVSLVSCWTYVWLFNEMRLRKLADLTNDECPQTISYPRTPDNLLPQYRFVREVTWRSSVSSSSRADQELANLAAAKKKFISLRASSQYCKEYVY
jgi:hypothetical protein